MTPPLTMRAWTERQGVGTDPYGGGGEWSDVLVEAPAYWWVTSGEERIRPQRAVSLGGEHCLFGRDADVVAGDRIRRLVDHQGRTVWDAEDAAGRAREIEHVAVERTHLDATIRSST